MYGTEYEDNYESTFNPFSVHRDNEDAPCVVCRSQRATTVMIPARTSCYNGTSQNQMQLLLLFLFLLFRILGKEKMSCNERYSFC
jgi:hypothetical protein